MARHSPMARHLYGPVSSWRLGRSLGINLLSGGSKACSFDCVYCQLGETVSPVVRRREYVALDVLAAELEALGDLEIDHATFSGMGEPTLAANLGAAIDLVHATLSVPVAVLTNSSLLHREDVRREIARADIVVAKLDAPDEATFRRVDRPRLRCSLDGIVASVQQLRREHEGRLALQMMFLAANRGAAAGMARLAATIGPDEVQICTPTRAGAAAPLPYGAIDEIRREFRGLAVRTVFGAEPPAEVPGDGRAAARRHAAGYNQGEVKGLG